MRNEAQPVSLSLFTRRVLVVVGIMLLAVLLAYFLWSVGGGILVVFAGVLFAILLDAIARVVCRYTPIRRGFALLIAMIFLALLAFGGSWFGGSRVAEQAPQLSRQLSKSLDRIYRKVQHSGLAPRSMVKGPTMGASGEKKVLSYGKQMIGNVTGLLGVTIGMVADMFIILIVGIYFSISPQFYVESCVLLVPAHKREHFIRVFGTIGHALRRWFLGRIMAMVLVGVLTTAGLYAIGVKLASLLGIIAGLLTFVPYLGAIISAVPAILVGVLEGPLVAVYVAILFLVVHIIEGYVFTPLVQKRIVHVAPAFLLIAQLLAGLFAGVFGIFVATPIAITLTIAVQMFYIEDVLAESPHILGEDDDVDDKEKDESRSAEVRH
jgi:predicted PurR-regulated permease PerM